MTSMHGTDAEAEDARRHYDKVLYCLRCYLMGPELPSWELLVGTAAELGKQIAIGQDEMTHKADATTWKTVEIAFRLAKWAKYPKAEAASVIALFWRERSAAKRARDRMESLLAEQETLLLQAVGALDGERERRVFEQKYKSATKRRSLTATSPQPLPTKGGSPKAAAPAKVEEKGGDIAAQQV